MLPAGLLAEAADMTVLPGPTGSGSRSVMLPALPLPVRDREMQLKLEISPVLRSTVYSPELQRHGPEVQTHSTSGLRRARSSPCRICWKLHNIALMTPTKQKMAAESLWQALAPT